MLELQERTAYRIALGATLVASLLLVWLSLGVGIIGRDGDPVNRIYLGVVAAGLLGSILVRFRARGMAAVLLAMALAQVVIATIALLAGWGRPWSGTAEIVLLNGFFAAAFACAAWLFRAAYLGGIPREVRA